MEKNEKNISETSSDDGSEMAKLSRIDRVKQLGVTVWNNMTIEPAYFLVALSRGMTGATSSQMVIYKSCMNDFPSFKEEHEDLENFCQNELIDDKESNRMVNDEVGEFNAMKSIVHSVIPCLLSFFAGAWADRFGRKRILFTYLILMLTESSMNLILAIKLDSKKEWLFLPEIPTSLIGGYGICLMALYSYLADITDPKDRPFRMGMLNISGALARPFSPIIGSSIYNACKFSGITADLERKEHDFHALYSAWLLKCMGLVCFSHVTSVDSSTGLRNLSPLPSSL